MFCKNQDEYPDLADLSTKDGILVGIFYTNVFKTCQYLVHACKANIVVVTYYVKLQNFFKVYFQKS